jgi:predicted acetyltransferase
VALMGDLKGHKLELVPVVSANLRVLQQLMELYLHDFSEFLPFDTGPDGRFVGPSFWRKTRARRNLDSFLLQIDNNWAGFVMVAHESWITADRNVHDMDEFFVMRKYRRQGVGRLAARRLFERFAGRWEVRVRDENKPALHFWKNAITAVTGGRFEQTNHRSPRWTGRLFAFKTANRSRAYLATTPRRR